MKYVIASRRLAGSGARAAASEAMERVFKRFLGESSAVRGETQAQGPFARHVRVFEAEEADVERMRLSLPDTVLLEPAIQHHPASAIGLRIEGAGGSLANARVIAFVRTADADILQKTAVSDHDGMVEFILDEHSVIDTIVVRPYGGFWSCVVAEPSPDTAIACQPLPVGPVGWWHELLGVRPSPSLGAGIKVGVVDTGVGPHPCLAFRDFGLFLDGDEPTLPGKDDDGHGTHVAGLVAAAQGAAAAYGGVAPGVSLASARVCGPSSKANQADIANALDALSEQFEADLINISLAATERSEILHEALVDALDRGTLCICAAGNSGGAVEYPAALPEGVAVAAIGKVGWGARGSLATLQQPPPKDMRHGNEGLYAAVFSCHGTPVFCAAPGVGIISTLPSTSEEALYAEMDGTSMASPLVCGTLAIVLASDRHYPGMARERARADHARGLLMQHCRSVGIPRDFEGHGVPQAP